jgi:hypothetical protein
MCNGPQDLHMSVCEGTGCARYLDKDDVDYSPEVGRECVPPPQTIHRRNPTLKPSNRHSNSTSSSPPLVIFLERLPSVSSAHEADCGVVDLGLCLPHPCRCSSSVRPRPFPSVLVNKISKGQGARGLTHSDSKGKGKTRGTGGCAALRSAPHPPSITTAVGISNTVSLEQAVQESDQSCKEHAARGHKAFWFPRQQPSAFVMNPSSFVPII